LLLVSAAFSKAVSSHTPFLYPSVRWVGFKESEMKGRELDKQPTREQGVIHGFSSESISATGLKISSQHFGGHVRGSARY